MSNHSEKITNDCPLYKDGKCRIRDELCYGIIGIYCNPLRRAYDIGFVDCHDLIHRNKINKNKEGVTNVIN